MGKRRADKGDDADEVASHVQLWDKHGNPVNLDEVGLDPDWNEWLDGTDESGVSDGTVLGVAGDETEGLSDDELIARAIDAANAEQKQFGHPTSSAGAPLPDRFTPETLFAEVRTSVALIGRQLPYLLLTGSSENYLRDTLAYQLSLKHRLVARDYPIACKGRHRKADIAILRESAPTTVIELKQLYLKDLRALGHGCIKNVTHDLTDRRSVCAEVYSVVFARRIVPGVVLPWANEFNYAYERADLKFAPDGIARLHGEICKLPAVASCYPAAWQAGQVLAQDTLNSGVELYAWVVKAS